MKLPYIKNHVSSEIAGVVEPWAYQNTAPAFADKSEARKWQALETTDHCFYNGFSGVNANIRVHKEKNPAKTLYALIGDYDFPSAKTEWQKIWDDAPEDFKPTAMSNTTSGHLRILWMLDKPVDVAESSLWPTILKTIAKKYKLKGIFKGLDDKFFDPSQYYDVGTNWQQFPGGITEEQIQTTIFETLKTVNYQSKVEIPFEKLAAQVEKAFPGGWSGEFVELSRGRRFWVEGSDGTSNCVALRKGMWDFVENRLVGWTEIFGAAFARAENDNRFGDIISRTHLADDNFYFFEDNRWRDYSKAEFSIKLQAEFNLNPRIEKGENCSEVNLVMNMVKRTRQVDAAVPLPHQPEYVYEANKKYLNTSTVKLIEPGDGGLYWGHRFEWIAKFLDNLFDNPEQLPIFLAHLQRALWGAQAKKPKLMRAVFLIGPPTKGKTFLAQQLIGPIFGGIAEAERYMTNETNFNSHLFEYFFWYLDELKHGMSDKEKADFSNKFKRLIANDLITCEKKFSTPVTLRRRGWIFSTSNNDESSSEALPNIEAEILDKIVFLQTGAVDLPTPKEGLSYEDQVKLELPHFVNYMTSHHTVPADIARPNTRFGVADYHHPDMIASVRENSGHTMLQEIVENYFIHHLPGLSESDKIWTGSATKLYMELSSSEAFGKMINRWTPKQFGNQLIQIKRSGSVRLSIDYDKHRESSDRWHIQLKVKAVKSSSTCLV